MFRQGGEGPGSGRCHQGRAHHPRRASTTTRPLTPWSSTRLWRFEPSSSEALRASLLSNCCAILGRRRRQRGGRPLRGGHWFASRRFHAPRAHGCAHVALRETNSDPDRAPRWRSLLSLTLAHGRFHFRPAPAGQRARHRGRLAAVSRKPRPADAVFCWATFLKRGWATMPSTTLAVLRARCALSSRPLHSAPRCTSCTATATFWRAALCSTAASPACRTRPC